MELEIIRFIQGWHNELTIAIFTIITMLGESVITILIFFSLYFLIDKRIGKRYVLFIGYSVALNGFLKNLFNRVRPIGMEGIVSYRIESATSSSFPSGHSMNATTNYLILSEFLKSKAFKIVGFILVLLVMFSRVFLGVHFPSDVIGGFIFALICFQIVRYLVRNINENTLFAVLSIVLHLSFLLSGNHEELKLAAGSFGLLVGFIVDDNLCLLKNPQSFKQRLYRLLIIAIVAVVSYISLKWFLPVGLIFDYGRYFVLMIIIMVVIPLIFRKLKL